MKRAALHIAFWLLYLLQDALLFYTWVGPSLGKMSDVQLVWTSLHAALVMLIPKLILAYFILYVSIKKITVGNARIIPFIAEILLVLVFSIFIYRVLGMYYLNPLVYGGVLKDQRFFEIRRILMALMDIGFATGIAVAIKFTRIQLRTKEKEKRLIKEKLETELKFLKNQTNPHFLMNTLNNIYALARKKSDDTAEVVMRLSELLRFMLYESEGDFIKLSEEVKVLEDYLELEKIRYNNRLKVQFSKDIDNYSNLITPMLLLTFVENAFKHGISETRFESFIRIEISVRNGHLIFLVENSNEHSNKVVVNNPIGLKNVRRQLELVYKEFDLETDNNNGVHKTKLSVNLSKHASI